MGDQNAGTLSIRVKGYPNPIEFGDWTHDRLWSTCEFEGGDSLPIQNVFGGSIGQPIPGGQRPLTEADTNLQRSGDVGIPPGWEMLVYSIQISIVREMLRTAAAGSFQMQDNSASQLSRPPHVGGYDPAVINGGVLFDFLRKLYHVFQYNMKVQSTGTVDKYPQGSGPTVFTTATSVEVASNGVPSPRDQAAFTLPIWLRPNVSFVSQLRPVAPLGIAGAPAGTVEGYQDWSGGAFVAAAAGFDVRVTLEGLLRRPVA